MDEPFDKSTSWHETWLNDKPLWNTDTRTIYTNVLRLYQRDVLKTVTYVEIFGFATIHQSRY